MERVESIKSVYLIAYRCKDSGKIGTMRFCEGNMVKATKLCEFMRKELDNSILELNAQRNTLLEKDPENREGLNAIEELLTYMRNVDIVIIGNEEEKPIDMHAFKVEV